MRLSDYLIRPVSTSTEPSGEYEKQLEAYNLAVNLINRMTHPIPKDYEHVLEQIRAEIEACREDEEPHLCDYRHYRNEGIDKALEVIDKYR